MCNLYSLNKKRDMVARYSRVSHNRAAAFKPTGANFPRHIAPVVCCADDGEREILTMSWGSMLLQNEPSGPTRGGLPCGRGNCCSVDAHLAQWRSSRAEALNKISGVEHTLVLAPTADSDERHLGPDELAERPAEGLLTRVAIAGAHSEYVLTGDLGGI